MTPRSLHSLRENRRWRTVALVVAAVFGVGLAWVHWLGLFLAGALVGLLSQSVARALVAGAIVGILVLLLNVLVIPTMDIGEFAGLTPASYVTVASSLLAPVWGSLIRGVV